MIQPLLNHALMFRKLLKQKVKSTPFVIVTFRILPVQLFHGYLVDTRLFVVSYATDENNQIIRATTAVREDVYGVLLYHDDGELEVCAFDSNVEEILCTGKVVPSTTSTKLVGIDFTDCTSTQILIESIPGSIYRFDPPTTTRRRALLKDGKSSDDDDDDDDDLMKTLIDKVKKNSMEPNDMVEKMKATAEHILS
jgi:hypothetical protein